MTLGSAVTKMLSTWGTFEGDGLFWNLEDLKGKFDLLDINSCEKHGGSSSESIAIEYGFETTWT